MRYILILILLTSISLYAYGSWKWQTDQGLMLMGIDALSPQVAWVAGASQSLGFIIKTTNGGASWTNQNASFTMVWMDIAFEPNGSIGIVSGLGMSILNWKQMAKTTNGGLSWTGFDVAATLTTEVKGCQFLAPLSFFAVANVGSNSTPELWRSTNAGQNWVRKTLNISNYTQDLYFLDQDHGWVVLGDWPDDSDGFARDYRLMKNPMKRFIKPANQYHCTIAYTSNGGNSWITQFDNTDKYYGFAISAVGSNNLWVACDGYGSGYGSVILHSTDGGSTWAEQTIPNANKVFLADVGFVDANNGWAAGGFAGSAAMLYLCHTTNGGQTWINDNMNLIGPALGMLMVDKANGWAVGANDVTQHGRIYNYFDPGAGFTGFKKGENLPDINIKAYPNPFRDRTSISFYMQQKGDAVLRLYDISGRCSLEKPLYSLSSGQNTVSVNRGNLGTGVYIAEISTKNISERCSTRLVCLD